MTVEYWDPDQAVTVGPLDEDLEGTCSADRYGVTGEEEICGEPLAVALAQEEPELVRPADSDDPWVLVEDDEDYISFVFRDRTGCSPEELALHLERS